MALALIVWLCGLLLAVPYALAARHAETRPLAAYLIFVTVFSAAAALLFPVLMALAQLGGVAPMLDNAVGAGLFLAAVFVPAFLLGRWQLRKPPRRPPRLS